MSLNRDGQRTTRELDSACQGETYTLRRNF